jgi:hypothetical protein
MDPSFLKCKLEDLFNLKDAALKLEERGDGQGAHELYKDVIVHANILLRHTSSSFRAASFR